VSEDTWSARLRSCAALVVSSCTSGVPIPTLPLNRGPPPYRSSPCRSTDRRGHGHDPAENPATG
jgi:hypothetical protein